MGDIQASVERLQSPKGSITPNLHQVYRFSRILKRTDKNYEIHHHINFQPDAGGVQRVSYQGDRCSVLQGIPHTQRPGEEDGVMSLSAHQSHKMKSDEWLTPPEILNALGTFDLDPCAPINRPWNMAKKHYTTTDDGLIQPWHGRVWLNPPFGREAVKWLRRIKEHGNGIALIPARTETKMFYEMVWGFADGVLFIKGRPHFYYVDGKRAAFNSGAPIALIAYGADNFDALVNSNLGFVAVAR